ncbi:hypothetical protein D3C75_522620 [compost metagenome]
MGRLRGAAGDVLGGGAHFVGGGRHLVHLAVLLLHAGAGLCGDGGRLIRGAAGVLHRALHFGNDRLQLVEETVEPAGQLAQFILLVVGQAAGQVTFAAGDVFEHVRHAEDRSGDAAGHQPHQQQTEQRGEHPQAELDQGTGGVAVIELLFQGFGGADQDFLRHVEQHAPGFTVGNRLEGCQHFQLLMAVQAGGFAAGGEHAQQFGAIGLIHGVQALAEFAGVRAVAGEQAGRADDADAGLAVIELLARAQADRLQAVEVDVHGQRGDHLAVDHQRENDAGHQHVLTVDFIEVRFDHARLERGARTGEPGVGRFAAGAGAGVGHVLFRQRHGRYLARRRLRPVEGETTLVVAAKLGLTGEQFVLAVQPIGFEHQGQAEQVRVGLQGRLDLAGQVFAQVEGIEKALLGLVTQEQHLPGETVAVLIGVHELLAYPQRLVFALGLDPGLGRLCQHLHARGFHQLGAVLHAVQRKTHQQGHDARQAQPGQQGDFPLNGKLSERHGDVLIR